MNVKKLIAIFFVSISFLGYTQKIDLKLTNKITINRDSDYVYAYTLPEKSTFAADEDKVYYWYTGGSIKSTRGGYEGKLLHGDFTCFYHNKNLEEKGKFKKGIKTGKWLHWYTNGELKSVYKWKNGQPVGKSYHYDSLRTKKEVVYYKNGRVKVKKDKKNVPHFFNKKPLSSSKDTSKTTIKNTENKNTKSKKQVKEKQVTKNSTNTKKEPSKEVTKEKAVKKKKERKSKKTDTTNKAPSATPVSTPQKQ